MNSGAPQIRFGELQDVIGHSRRHGDVVIVPAVVRFTGSPLTNGSHFDEYLADQPLLDEVKRLIRPGQDAPWVCSRIQRVFLSPQIPEEDRPEKSCMSFSFLAVLPDAGQHIGIPFECTDYYGRSTLILNGDSPPQALIDRIATAFWQTLLEDPHDLVEFTDRFSHLGGGFDVRFGVRDGEPFMEEIAE